MMTNVPFPYLSEALWIRRADDAVAAFAAWELARGTESLAIAQRNLVLDRL